MFYIRVGIAILFLFGTISSFIYSFNIFYRLIGKRLSKNEAISRTFLSTFWGIMLIFFSYFIVEVKGNLGQWVFAFFVFAIISFIIAISSVAPYWQWKE